MELQTQILNIPICHDLNYTPITKADINSLPIGTNINSNHHLYKALLRNPHPGLSMPKGYYDSKDDKFYEIELKTHVCLPNMRDLYITEVSGSDNSRLDWYISLYEKGARILHVQSRYAEVRITGPFTDCVFTIRNGTLLSQDIGQFVRFNKASPGTNPAFFKGANLSNKLGYKIHVHETADCPPVYFDKGVLSADDKEEAVEYIDSMLNNLLAAKRSILETNIIPDGMVEQYCKSLSNLVSPEDVLFKGI